MTGTGIRVAEKQEAVGALRQPDAAARRPPPNERARG